MQVTSEDKANVNAAAAAEKPKRTRRRKADTHTSPAADQPATVNQPVITTSAPLASEAEIEPVVRLPETDAPASMGPSVATGSGCGNVLKAARESQGLSIHEVSSQLRLGIKQIQAIEQDDFDKLPQPSIVRGFIRNYARLLNIDVAPILEAYQRIVPNNAPLPLSIRSNARPSVIDKPVPAFRPQRILTFFIFLILAAILAYFYINHIKPQALKNASLALDVDNISETTGQEITIPAPPAESLPPSVADTASQETSTEVPLPAVTETSTTTVSDTETAPTPAPVQEAASVTPANSDSTIVSTPTPATNNAAEIMTLKAADPQKTNLVFRVTEDSWVRIEDMQGKKIFSEVLTAGSEHTVVAEKPVNVIVGHAGVTQLTIDNQPYDLTQATRGRVARIQLK